MLRRPILLLNPWSLRKTETGTDVAAAGEKWSRKAEGRGRALSRYGGKAGEPRQPGGTVAGAFANLDFLPTASAVLPNLVPDKNGQIEIPRKILGGGQQLHLLAINHSGSVYRTAVLPESGEQFRDRRMARILDPARHFTEQKKVSVAAQNKAFTIGDIRTSALEVYDSLAKVYGLYSTLSGNATLTEFGFILKWPDLEPDEKKKLYSKYACHELSFFLFKKDPGFFKRVVLPYLRNKKDRTFMDHWLLGEHPAKYMQPWSYHRLNIAERILLARQVQGEAPHGARHVKDLFDLVPPDIERFNRLFKTALRAGALEQSKLQNMLADKSAELADMDEAAAGLGTGFALAATRAAALPPGAPKPSARPAREALRSELVEKKKALKELQKGGRADFGRAPAEMAMYFEAEAGLNKRFRKKTRAYYRKLDKTEEWVENNYYKLPIEQQLADLVKVNGFWKDYAAHDGKTPFVSGNVAEATGGFTEMMLALAVLDLPFKAGEHKTDVKGASLTLTPAGDVVVYHKEINPAQAEEAAQVVLVSQNFFELDDHYRHENNERFDKFVTAEFQIGRVYGCQVVLTNPTSTRRKVDVLLQIPEGALPVLKGTFTRSLHRQLEPYSTQSLEYHFYFPAPGDCRHYPVHVAQNEKLIAFARPFVFNVKTKLTQVDTEAWAYVSQHGSGPQVLEYLRTHNIDRVDLGLVAFRMRDKGYFRQTIDLLKQRHVYNGTLWSYGVYHKDADAMREYLPHTTLANRCGVTIESPLLTIDPVTRHTYQHKEYWPLVNARVYHLGRKRKILNRQFHDQYHQFMRYLAYRPALNDDDRMVTVIYLLLQDRVEEALKRMDAIQARALHTDIQYDYLRAYMAFYREDPKGARKVAAQYKDYPAKRWRDLFGDVLAQVDEIQGKASKVVDDKDRTQLQTQLAATAPALDIKLEDRTLVVQQQNLASCTVNFYLMNLELLFSKQPFVQDVGDQFSVIRPNRVAQMKFKKNEAVGKLALPKDLCDRNLMIEVSGGGLTRMQASGARDARQERQSAVESVCQGVRTHERRSRAVLQRRLHGPARAVRLHVAEHERTR